MDLNTQTTHRPLPSRPQTSRSHLEKRGTGRLPARSAVELRYGRNLGAKRIGNLLDVGRTKFRAGHRDRRIVVGKLVAFRHQFADGYARVKWTRRIGAAFESGFEVVRE